MILTKRPYLDACHGRAEKNVLHAGKITSSTKCEGGEKEELLAASLQILCFTSFHLAFRQQQTLLGPGGHALLALCLHPPAKALGSSILIA